MTGRTGKLFREEAPVAPTQKSAAGQTELVERWRWLATHRNKPNGIHGAGYAAGYSDARRACALELELSLKQ